jgi:hypothetical protein
MMGRSIFLVIAALLLTTAALLLLIFSAAIVVDTIRYLLLYGYVVDGKDFATLVCVPTLAFLFSKWSIEVWRKWSRLPRRS